MTSAKVAKLASTPPVVGFVSMEMNGKEWSASMSSATTVLAICIKERIPSCMRAPPEAVTDHQGHRLIDGSGNEQREALADHRAHRTAKEPEVHDPQRHAPPGQSTEAGEHRLRQPGLVLRFGEPVHIGATVVEVEGIRRLKVTRHLLPGAGIGQLRDPLGRAQREMMPAVRADSERRLELFRGQSASHSEQRGSRVSGGPSGAVGSFSVIWTVTSLVHRAGSSSYRPNTTDAL